MKKIFALSTTLSLLTLMACSDKATVKNEACIGKKGTTAVVCGEIAGSDFTDAECANKFAGLVTAFGTQGTLTAAVSCPTGSTANCDLKDSTGTTTKTYFYGTDGLLLSAFACQTTLP